jgi:preprotein translocase subunit SecE
MAVAEAVRVEKNEKQEKEEVRDKDRQKGGSAGGPSGGPPSWVTWLPRKWAELRAFFVEVKSELKKVTWPSKTEVQATTVVVVITTVVFGFYLYGMDLGFSFLLSLVLGQR